MSKYILRGEPVSQVFYLYGVENLHCLRGLSGLEENAGRRRMLKETITNELLRPDYDSHRCKVIKDALEFWNLQRTLVYGNIKE